MARVLVATQSWGVLWERESDRSLKVPAAGVLAVLDTTVYAASSGGTVIAPSAFVTNADGELPGYVDEGAWSLTVGLESFPVAALGGTLPGRVTALEDGGGGGSGTILPWVTAHAYSQGQPVTNGGHTYLARNAHTSGATFAGDLAAHWDLLPLTAGDVGADAAGAATAAQAAAQAASIPLAQKAAISGVASLDGAGKVPTAQLPALAITSVFVVASQAAQLALTAQEGDVAVRSDQGKSYIQNGGSAGSMADWTELQTPTDLVLSVAGKTGAVSLTGTDVAFTPGGTVAGTNLQTAVAEVASEGNTRLTALELASTKLPGVINAFTRTRYYPNAQSPSSVIGAMYRVRHRALTGGFGAILRYGNAGGDASGSEGTTGNDITIKAAIEDSAGNIYPVFFRGQRSYTLQPKGGIIDSDPVGVDWVVNDVFFVRTLVTVATTGMKWPESAILLRRKLGDGIELGTTIAAPTDKTDSGTVTAVANDTTYSYGPMQILSERPVANPLVLAIKTDSIGQGTGDQAVSPGGGGDLGYVERALYRVNAPAVDVARFGEQAAGWTPVQRVQRMKILGLAGATHLINGLGINDFSGSATMAQMQARQLAQSTIDRARGIAPTIVTVTPRTTSTDEWRTVGSQTTSLGAAETARTGYNDWLRGGSPIDPTTLAAVAVGTGGALLAGVGAHPFAGYFEAADTVESARNSGKWAPFMTYDGLHPTALGHRALAAAVDTTLFGFAAQPAAVAFPSGAAIPGLKFRYSFQQLPLANAANVAAVTDLGPNGWNLAVTGAGTDPTFQRAAYWGNPGVQFVNGKTLDNASVTVAQPDTIIAVCQPNSTTGAMEPFDGITTRQRLNLGSSVTGANADIFAGSIKSPIPYPFDPSFGPCAFVCVFNGASSHVEVNGVVGTTGNAGANSLVGLRVGSAMTGGVLELFAYDHDVTAVPAEKAALEAYLAYAYDIRYTGQPQVY